MHVKMSPTTKWTGDHDSQDEGNSLVEHSLRGESADEEDDEKGKS